MKANWEEGKGVNADWLPPFTEWDFRTIKERESRMACCWEYARNTPSICECLTSWLDGSGGITTLGKFICEHGLRFPEPWLTACDELRNAGELVEGEESPITVYSLEARKEYVLREVAAALRNGDDVLARLDQLLFGEGYAVTLDFRSAGGHAVAKALSAWARLEAKKFPSVRRGKGAAPPFEMLKWLAALRLEAARQEAGASFSEVEAALGMHQRDYPIADASPTLPLYSGHAAWSKAIGDARRSVRMLAKEPVAFEQRILLF